MPRIVTRTVALQKLAIDRGIKPTAHAVALATGITYETMRRVFNGDPVSEKTMSALLAHFGVSWDELFILELDETDKAAVR